MARWRVAVEIEAEGETRGEAVGWARRVLDRLVAQGVIAAFLNAVLPPRAAPLPRRQRLTTAPRDKPRPAPPAKSSGG